MNTNSSVLSISLIMKFSFSQTQQLDRSGCGHRHPTGTNGSHLQDWQTAWCTSSVWMVNRTPLSFSSIQLCSTIGVSVRLPKIRVAKRGLSLAVVDAPSWYTCWTLDRSSPSREWRNKTRNTQKHGTVTSMTRASLTRRPRGGSFFTMVPCNKWAPRAHKTLEQKKKKMAVFD